MMKFIQDVENTLDNELVELANIDENNDNNTNIKNNKKYESGRIHDFKYIRNIQQDTTSDRSKIKAMTEESQHDNINISTRRKQVNGN